MESRPDAGSSCTLDERQVEGISVVGVAGVVDMLTAPDLETVSYTHLTLPTICSV